MRETELEHRRRLGRERQARYRLKHPEKARKTTRELMALARATDPEKQRAIQKRYRDSHPEKIKATRKAFHLRNPHKATEAKARRKALVRSQSPADANRRTIQIVYDMANRATRIVGTPYHVDHIEPLSKGGLHHQDNLVVMRADWNIKKGATDWPWLKWFNEGI